MAEVLADGNVEKTGGQLSAFSRQLNLEIIQHRRLPLK
jgi:hypothetical protein